MKKEYILNAFGIIGTILSLLSFIGIKATDFPVGPISPLLNFIKMNWYWFAVIGILLLVIWFLATGKNLFRKKNHKISEDDQQPAIYRVRLFLPSTIEHSFWSNIESEIIGAADKDHDNDITIYPKFLKSHYSQSEQLAQLKDENNWDNIDAAIVCPVSDKVLNQVRILMEEGKKIVVHDISEEKMFSYFALLDMCSPHFVTVDNIAGGKLAAEVMYNYIKNKSNNGFDVLLVHGEKAQSHSHQRIIGFLTEMQEKTNNDIAVYYTDEGKWEYDQAKREFSAYVKNNLIINKNNRNILGIFACNDEMALAINDYIIDNNTNGFKDVIIVGFDKTQELLDAKRRSGTKTKIIGTVDSKISEQAEWLYKYVKEILLNEATMSPVFKLIEPEKVEL